MSWLGALKSRELVTAAPYETVATVVARMVESRVGAVLVVNDGKLTGIFSERDVMTRVVAPGHDPGTTTVTDVQTRDPQVVLEDTDLATCVDLVTHRGFRHIPVVNAGGAPIAVISSRDFLGNVVQGLERAVTEAQRQRRREAMVDPYELVHLDEED